MLLVLVSCDPFPDGPTKPAAPPQGVSDSCEGSIGDEADSLFPDEDVYRDDHVLPWDSAEPASEAGRCVGA
jgi:hypothetical protein